MVGDHGRPLGDRGLEEVDGGGYVAWPDVPPIVPPKGTRGAASTQQWEDQQRQGTVEAATVAAGGGCGGRWGGRGRG